MSFSSTFSELATTLIIQEFIILIPSLNFTPKSAIWHMP